MHRTPVARLALSAARLADASHTTPPPTLPADLKHQLKTRDVRLTIPTKDHLISVSFVSTRALLAEAIARHELIPRTAAFVPFLQNLGTQLSFTHLLAAPLSGEERVEARLTTDEATIHTSALGLGEGLGYIRPAYNVQMLEKGEVQLPFPLKVDRILYNQHQPFSSAVTASLEEMLTIDDADRGQAESRLTTPPLSLALSSLTAGGDDASGADVSWYPTLQGVVDYFSHNSTLHAYNYYRRSDGTPSAVWMQTEVSATRLTDAGLLTAEGKATDENRLLVPQREADQQAAAEQLARLKMQLLTAIPFSFGIQLTPLAAGTEVEWKMWTLQRVVAAASAAIGTQAPPHTSASPSPLAAVLQTACESHTVCQTVLSFLTGDFEGACTVAKRGRQYTCDPATMARLVEPVRAQCGIDAIAVTLDTEAVARTPLDFFCRCSKANMLRSFISLPDATLDSLMSQTSFQCASCGRQHIVSAEDWGEVKAARAASKPPSS